MSGSENTWSQFIDPALWEDSERFRSLVVEFGYLVDFDDSIDIYSDSQATPQGLSDILIWANDSYDILYEDEYNRGLEPELDETKLPPDVVKERQAMRATVDERVESMSVEGRKGAFDYLFQLVRDSRRRR